MAGNRSQGVATLVTGIDIRALPIGPQEAFVLSRVDGQASVTDIAFSTGMTDAQVTEILTRLADHGAVRFGDSVRPRHTPPGSFRAGPSVPPLYAASELDEPAGLTLERKRQILDWFHGLDLLTYYELLGLAPDADKKDVRESYFDVVAVFHPDRYFGKDLGSFKSKLERVFQRLTEAHEVLSRRRLRAEYDEAIARATPPTGLRASQRDATAVRIRSYFASARNGRNPSRSQTPVPLLGTPTTAESSPRIMIKSDPEAARAAELDAEQAPTTPSGTPVPPRHTPTQIRARTTPKEEEEARRRALARKIRASIPPPNLRRGAEPALDPPNSVERYLRLAEEALLADNPLSATNALRVAASIAPDDLDIAARLHEVERMAAASMADQYLASARSEESAGRYETAAELYAKVGLGRPSAAVFERAALCLLQAQKDLRRAADFAKQALILAPNRAELHLLLGRIYIGANMKRSALTEIERAAKLAPTDATIREWLRKIKRGEI